MVQCPPKVAVKGSKGRAGDQVPANRIGHSDAGMPAAHLRAIAELFILVAFLAFSQFVLCEPVRDREGGRGREREGEEERAREGEG